MRVRDVTLRDGLQDEAPIATVDKLAIYESLVAAGVDDLEVTSFVRPDRVPAMADAEAVAAAVAPAPGVTHWGLVLNERGAQRAVAAGIDHLQFVLSVSETHNRANAGCSVGDSVERLRSLLAGLSDTDGATEVAVEVTLATSFGCPFDGPVAPDAVVALADTLAALDAGGLAIASLTLADTIGTGAPSEVRRLVARLVAAGHTRVGVHLHDTRGLALANVLAAAEAGAVRADASVGGLGGCPFAPGASGNVAIEDLVHGLHAEGIPTGLDVDGLVAAAAVACAAVGRPVASHVGVAGPRFGRRTPRRAGTDRR